MSAKQGDPAAQFILGGKHDIGDGFPRDPAKAAEWWHKAAEQNDANAQFALGAAYGAGQGVEKDETIAVEWMRKSATQGHYRAQLSLGVRYADGIGVQQDLVEGFMWLSLGAQGLQQQLEKSSPLKSELSGSEMGAAARKSPNAFFDEAALELLERLKIEMKPEQIAEAHRRIASYQEKIQTRR